MIRERGHPQQLVMYNDPGFTGNRWNAGLWHRVKLAFIQLEEAGAEQYEENFSGTCRNEWVNEHWFVSLGDRPPAAGS